MNARTTPAFPQLPNRRKDYGNDSALDHLLRKIHPSSKEGGRDILRAFISKGGQLKDKEKWMELCERAAEEQDPEKLMALVKEIDRLLQEKEDRLAAFRKQDRENEPPL